MINIEVDLSYLFEDIPQPRMVDVDQEEWLKGEYEYIYTVKITAKDIYEYVCWKYNLRLGFDTFEKLYNAELIDVDKFISDIEFDDFMRDIYFAEAHDECFEKATQYAPSYVFKGDRDYDKLSKTKM